MIQKDKMKTVNSMGVIPAFSEDRGLPFLKYEVWGYETLKSEEVKTQ